MSGGIQNKLAKKQAGLKRKLMDYKIRLSGNCSQIIRIYTEENKYGDETLTTINHCMILAIIDYPGELPLYRLRTSADDSEIDEPTGIFLYDIIPIEVYTQWKDKVEIGDLLVRKIKDETDSCLVNVLRISNILGSFKTDLIWKKCLTAPYNMTISQEVQDIIDAY